MKKQGKGLKALLDDAPKTSSQDRSDFFCEMNTEDLKPHMSKRFYAACASKNDFDNLNKNCQEKIVGERAPDFFESPRSYATWLAKGRAKWLYMQADEILKQEGL